MMNVASVVIPARNAASTIGEQLRALSGQSYTGKWETVVVTNGKSDETGLIVRQWQPKVPGLRVIDAPHARGVNHARNIGCHATHGDYLLFCDADDIVDSKWVAAMVDGLQVAHAAGGRLERESLNTTAALAARPVRVPNGLSNLFGFLVYSYGSNAAVRRSVWSQLGGFDENYRYGADDVEFFWRVQLAGYDITYAPDAVVHYRLRNSARALAYQGYRYGREHPQLFRDFKTAGMPATSWAEVIDDWQWIATHIPDVARSAEKRAVWAYRTATRLGRIAGSLRSRTLYL
jgi:glycosyltransferase involved in cell wall biosynthesis